MAGPTLGNDGEKSNSGNPARVAKERGHTASVVSRGVKPNPNVTNQFNILHTPDVHVPHCNPRVFGFNPAIKDTVVVEIAHVVGKRYAVEKVVLFSFETRRLIRPDEIEFYSNGAGMLGRIDDGKGANKKILEFLEGNPQFRQRSVIVKGSEVTEFVDLKSPKTGASMAARYQTELKAAEEKLRIERVALENSTRIRKSGNSRTVRRRGGAKAAEGPKIAINARERQAKLEQIGRELIKIRELRAESTELPRIDQFECTKGRTRNFHLRGTGNSTLVWTTNHVTNSLRSHGEFNHSLTRLHAISDPERVASRYNYFVTKQLLEQGEHNEEMLARVVVDESEIKRVLSRISDQLGDAINKIVTDEIKPVTSKAMALIVKYGQSLLIGCQGVAAGFGSFVLENGSPERAIGKGLIYTAAAVIGAFVTEVGVTGGAMAAIATIPGWAAFLGAAAVVFLLGGLGDKAVDKLLDWLLPHTVNVTPYIRVIAAEVEGGLEKLDNEYGKRKYQYKSSLFRMIDVPITAGRATPRNGILPSQPKAIVNPK